MAKGISRKLLSQLEAGFNNPYWQRGKEYYSEGLIGNIVKAGDVVRAESYGNSTYRLEINLKEGSMSCTCPCNFACKHLAALILWLKNNKVTEISEMENSLRSKTKEELIAMISQMVKANPEISAYAQSMDAREIEQAIKSGNYLTLRSLIYKFLSNILIIGKIDYTISVSKGQNIGYGISMPFNNVTVRLTYRIVARDTNTGKMNILQAGTEEGKGLAGNVEDATALGHKDLAEKLTPVILEKVSQYIKGAAKKVQVKVEGVGDINTNFAVKDALQNIAWVTAVEEKGLGEFVVSYTENT
ncbi:MAG: hypothetical protein QME12_05100, partial [Nanoarchaeota archaeon]|nr:hypothetical protein [Nanoarchaeota archaeon]